jgi:hypothetical protein
VGDANPSGDVRQFGFFCHHLREGQFLGLLVYVICDLPRKLWEELDHDSGSMWTIQRLKHVLAGLLDDTVEDTPTFQRGITQDPLFNSVDLSNYILSLLYIEVDVGNQLPKMLLNWIDKSLENIGEEELDIWDEYYKALMEY